MMMLLHSSTLLAMMLVSVARAPKPGPPPRLTMPTPLTVEAGKTTKLIVRGQNLEAVNGIECDEPKSKITLLGKPKKVGVPNTVSVELLGDWELELELQVAPSATGTQIGFKVKSPGGISNLATVALADKTTIVPEKEPNGSLTKPQSVPVPCVVESRIEKELDVDVYRFSAKTGEKIRIEIEAAKYGSAADLSLTLYDDRLRILDTSDDSRTSIDPLIQFTAPRDGEYTIALLESYNRGGNGFPYRLILRRE